jgi:hypothetical protein
MPVTVDETYECCKMTMALIPAEKMIAQRCASMAPFTLSMATLIGSNSEVRIIQKIKTQDKSD